MPVFSPLFFMASLLLRESIRIILLIQLVIPYPHTLLADDAVSERVQLSLPGSLPGSLNERSYAETIEFFRYLNILSAQTFRFLQDQIQTKGWEGGWETNENLKAYQEMTELLFNSWLSVMKLPVLDSNPLEESLRELPPLEVDPFLNRIQLETQYQVDLKTWKIPSLSEILSQFQNSKIRLPSKMALTRGMKMTFLYEYLQRTLEFYQIHGATHPQNAPAPEWNVKLPRKYRLYFDEVFGSSILTVTPTIPTINDKQDFELSLSKLTRLHLLQTGEGFHPDVGKYLRLVKFLLIYQFLIRGAELSRYKSMPSVFQYELPEGEFSALDGAAEEIFQNMEAAEKEFVFRTKLSDIIREDALEDLPIFFDRELISDALEYVPAFNDPEQADLLYQKYVLADGEEPELEEHTLLKNQVGGTPPNDSENNEEETEEPHKDVSILLTSFARVSLSEMDLENLSSFFMRLFLFLQRRAAYQRCLMLVERSPEQNLSAEARKIHYLLQLREADLSQDPTVIESYQKITQRWLDKMSRQHQDDFKPRHFLLKKLKEESRYLIELDAKIKQAESGVDVAAEALPEDMEAYFQTRQMIEMLPDSPTPPSSPASESHLRTLFKDWTKGRESALERLNAIEQKLKEPSEGVERTLLLEERDDLSNFVGSLPAVTPKSPLSSSSLEFKGAYLTQLRKSHLLQNRILLAPLISPIKSEEKELYKVFHEIEKSDHDDKEILLEKSLDRALELQENNIRKSISDLLKAQDLEDLKPFIQTGVATLALMSLNPEWQGIQEQIDEQFQPGFLENTLNIYLPRIFWCEMALLLVLVAGTFLFPAIAPATALPIKALGAAIFVEIVILDSHTLYRILPGWFPFGGSQAKEIARLDQIIHSTVLSGGDDKLISLEAREMLDNQLWWERALAMTLALPIQFFYYRSVIRRVAYVASQSPRWPGRLSHARKTLDVSTNATLEEIDAAVRKKLTETQDAARAAEIKFSAEILKDARSREVLQITKVFTPDELEQAFKKKAFELHPDHNPNLDGKAFGEVRIAYDYLGQFAPYAKACRLFGLKTDSFLTPPVLERIYEKILKNLGDSRIQRILGVMSKNERLSLFEKSLSEPIFRQNGHGKYETLRSGIQKGDGRALRIWLQYGDRLTMKETVQRVLEENYGFLLKESEKNYVAYILSKYGPQVYGYFGFRRKVEETIEAMKKGAAEGPKAFEEILLTDIIERIESGDLHTRGIIQVYFQDAAFVCDQLRKAREFVRRGVMQDARSPVEISGPALLPEEATRPPKESE